MIRFFNVFNEIEGKIIYNSGVGYEVWLALQK
jgi:hypothetical protein